MDIVRHTLSHYCITGELSRGGMGIVYRATDTRLNREVALKVLPEDLIHDPDRRRRFLQEAQAASAIEHPNVAVIYDADEADGRTFIAMELVRGQKLSDWLARGKPPVSQALDLATEIAAGLSRAHERQIVHRDLKPANVMVTDDGHAKIIDFGIAKLLESAPGAADETRASQDTASGVVLGTMTYMSPEQARGEKVDPRTDIFSFGIVLHEMLSGQPPFQGKSGLETAAAILHAPHPRLVPLGAGVLSDVTHDLQRIIDKCLEKDPANRYQSVMDLVVDLRAVRRRLESGAQPATTMAQAPVAPARRWSLAWIVAGGAALVAIVAAGLLWRSRPPATPPADATGASAKPSVAVMYFDNTTGAPDMNWMRTGITEMVATDLSQSPDLEVVSTDRVYAALASLKKTDDATIAPDVVTEVAERTGADRVIVGSYMKAGDVVRVNIRVQDVKTGHIVTSESAEGPTQSDLFKMVDDLAGRIRTTFAERRPATAPGNVLAQPGAAASAGSLNKGLSDVTSHSIDAFREYSEGIALHERGQDTDAQAHFEKAVAIDPTFAMAYVKLAVIAGNNLRADLSNKYATLALRYESRLTPHEQYYIEGYYYSQRSDTLARGIDGYSKCAALDPGDVACQNNLGLLLLTLERYRESAQHFEELVRRGDSTPAVFDNLATADIALGQPDQAIDVTESLVKAHPEMAAAHGVLAGTLLAAGKNDEARKEADQALALDSASPLVPVYRGYASVFLGDWSAARAAGASLESGSTETARWFGGLMSGTVAAFTGHCTESIDAFKRSVAAFSVPTVNTAAARGSEAEAELGCGQIDAALTTLEKAAIESKDDLSEPDVHAALAMTLAAAGRQAEADAEVAKVTAKTTPLTTTTDNRTLALARGTVALARRDYATAVSQLQQAQAALPPAGPGFRPSDHVEIWYALGQAYVGAGQPKNAAPWFEKVINNYERVFSPFEAVRSLYYLGTIREQTGDVAGARDAYGRFLGYWKDGTIDRDHVADAERKLQRLK